MLPTANTARIGEALRDWRYRRRQTQAQAGLALGVDQSTVSRAERGRIADDNPALHKICVGIGTPLHLEAVDPAAATAAHQLPPILAAALRRVWDGSPASTERVARLLEAAAVFRGPVDSTGVTAEARSGDGS